MKNKSDSLKIGAFPSSDDELAESLDEEDPDDDEEWDSEPLEDVSDDSLEASDASAPALT